MSKRLGEKTIPVILPAEGDSVSTMHWYWKALKEHDPSCRPMIFPASPFRLSDDVDYHMHMHFSAFFAEICVCNYITNGYRLELHAQGGFGAYTAACFLNAFPEIIQRVFFIGGAPCEAMTPIAKIFHRYISRLWCLSPIPFFADDPNPTNDEIIRRIKESSIMTMRKNPRYYRNQLVHIGNWSLDSSWRVPESCSAYFIPNGDTIRPSWWDNTYDNEKAAEIWRQCGVTPLPKPGDNFSFYSLMPAESLFRVMDTARDIEDYLVASN